LLQSRDSEKDDGEVIKDEFGKPQKYLVSLNSENESIEQEGELEDGDYIEIPITFEEPLDTVLTKQEPEIRTIEPE
jgi:hypothetical protein